MKICEETAPGAARARARNDTAEVFESHRPRLFRLAYRMLGSCCDAEDLVQDAYLRWHQSATQDIQSPAAFLVTITTRLCLDRLRELKQEREHYVGRWLPEPIVEDLIPSPEMQLELADEVSIAFLAVLERLGPEERGSVPAARNRRLRLSRSGTDARQDRAGLPPDDPSCAHPGARIASALFDYDGFARARSRETSHRGRDRRS